MDEIDHSQVSLLSRPQVIAIAEYFPCRFLSNACFPRKTYSHLPSSTADLLAEAKYLINREKIYLGIECQAEEDFSLRGREIDIAINKQFGQPGRGRIEVVNSSVRT